MSIYRRHYAQGTYLDMRLPFATFTGAKVLCSDGKVRRVKRIAPTADTFFSIPASVTVRGKTVAGYVTFATQSGSSTETPDDPARVEFRAYTYRRNAGSLPAEWVQA